MFLGASCRAWSIGALILFVATSIGAIYVDTLSIVNNDPPSHSLLFDPIAMTPTGNIKGFSYYYQAPNTEVQQQILAWRGIPFAQPPVGDLRWKAPKPLPTPSDLNHVYDALSYAEPCVQFGGGGTAIGSEDCLYLNVYSILNPAVDYSAETRTNTSTSGGFPVLFFIYGGGLNSGAANATFDSLLASFADDGNADGEKVNAADAGLTVVEVSYRLNAFGWLATTDLSIEGKYESGVRASGNFGLMDQIAGLEWTSKNIAAFGGDPKRVTIAGQSSGGTSVLALLAADKSRTEGLFSAGISMSGSTNITMSLDAAEKQNKNFSQGCVSPTEDYASTLACMRAWKAVEVLSRVPASWNLPGIWNLPSSQSGQHYVGQAIVDGAVIPVPLETALATGSGNDVPLMFGNMQAECDEGPELVVANYTSTQWRALLNTTFGPWVDPSGNSSSSIGDGNTPYGLAVATNIFHLYHNKSKVSPQYAFDSIVADYGLYCSNQQLVKAAKSQWYKNNSDGIRGKYQSNIFLYYDTWALSQPYISPWSGNKVQWAFHDLFYFMVTGQWMQVGDGIANYHPSKQDLRGSRFLQSLWRSFLRNSNADVVTGYDDDDNDATNGVTKHIWLPVNRDTAAFDTVAGPVYSGVSIFKISSSNNETANLLSPRQDVCTYYSSIGLDRQDFWWVN